MSKEREEQIRERAYQLWQADGAPEDRAEDYWIQAEGQIDAENGNQAPTKQAELDERDAPTHTASENALPSSQDKNPVPGGATKR